ncbi:geranylgeranyl pyrophosphate synthetase [Yamadazyma tenuis]|uniref:Terpenoid synthase n=1 Tax=Candida tenuis (strain ATCC 10573 / BCRC 21748 / CBS 615 / JCM 9827 / NBRC 10315 / NRRL Y-1498 / VKM Y-70) TaxID=590646 RepID=G3B0P4_CANTC|nr:terpenoid synthase [Yamadazyma tenuis ATCC 10573]EGV65441.1 terpenoid synthase [Yamadazyma tenuis ATCC 10573]WEJ94876.1 geranylgeranyl pyrophosphate synthetase [Yamadazyma tenuis]
MEKLIYRDDTPLDRHDPKTTLITEPYEYLQKLPGNNRAIRIVFIKAFNDLYFGIDNDGLINGLNELVDMLHDCSLIIDDVEDSSEYRRGALAAHLKFGVPSTVNCVNYMYFVAIDKASKLAPLYTSDLHEQELITLRVNKIITDEMLNLHHGQGVDIYWRDNKSDLPRLPTEEEYLEMVMDKTGGLLRIMVKVLEAFKPSKSTKHVALTSLIGIIYQLRDDYFNLTSDKYSHMKGVVGEDLIEGKFSFPILHSLRFSMTSPLYELLYNRSVEKRKSSESHHLIAESIKFMTNESNSLEYTNNKLKECLNMARKLIETDPTVHNSDSTYILQILHQLSDT